jgi:hypothetical protein
LLLFEFLLDNTEDFLNLLVPYFLRKVFFFLKTGDKGMFLGTKGAGLLRNSVGPKGAMSMRGAIFSFILFLGTLLLLV